ncbi:hypothetical protein [Chryseobacterium sp. ISL-6]|uniref:hypothetical protein n=1 Tax=Chryseobacterium sp. ISL-6 TaxID=2819143 RepID=UPI001BE7D847|nr:hypothetical protein [Chryseobacterium sp. ISL-6]MBT2620606.1 hypothetical protein [Chryseobacterium sp. ISL-6]
MKKTVLCWLILICSTCYSQSRITTSNSSKTQSIDKAKDKSGITIRKVTQKTDDVIFKTGNFGIGTIIPVGKFEVVSDNIGNDYGNKYFFRGFGTSKEPSIILTSANGTATDPLNLANNDFIGSIYFSPMVAGAVNIPGGSSINSYYRGDGTTLFSDLIFRTSNGEQMRIDPNGNIGIGTSTPNSILDLGPSHGTSPTDVLGKKLTVYNNESGTSFYGLGSSTGILQFHAASTPAKAPEMVLSSIGYVGIGTTAPSTILDLGSTIGSNPTHLLGKKLAVYNDASGNDFYGLGTSKDILQFHAASTPAEAPGMVLSAAGKVGIGTTTPSSILDLGTTIGNDPNDVSGKKFAVYNDATGTNFYGLGSSNGILQFHAGSTSTKAPGMVLNTAGNLGIGTNTPNTVLDLGSTIGSNPTHLLGKKLAVYNDASGNDFYGLGTSKDILQFHAASTPTEAPGMVLNSSGKVGIGTTTPTNVLDLGPNVGIDPNDALGKKLAVYNNVAGTNFYGLGSSNGILQFHAGSTPTKAPGMVLNSAGNVGIGTLTPLKKLDIEGSVRISQTQTDNTPKNLVSGTSKPLYVNNTDGTVRYAPDGYTRVSGGFRPGGNTLIATFPNSNTLARVRFVNYVSKSDNNNNGTKAAYSYGDFTIIGTDFSNPITFIDVVVKGYDGKPRAFTSTNTSISWTNANLGTTTILLDQTTGELRVTNTNTLVYSYFFEILGGI